MKVALQGRDKEDFSAPPLLPPNPNAVAKKEDTPDVKPGEETQ